MATRSVRTTNGSLLTGGERARIKRLGEPIALALGRLGLSPDALTLLGFGIVLAAAAAAAQGGYALAAAILVFGTLFDGLDGTLARATGRVTAFGAFLDSSLDRAGEAVIYAGIAYGAAVAGDEQLVAAAVLALGLGSLVSYVRARGEGLGVCADVGLAQRAERALLLVVGLAAGAAFGRTWLLAALVVIVAASAITVAQRILFVRAALVGAPRAAGRAARSRAARGK